MTEESAAWYWRAHKAAKEEVEATTKAFKDFMPELSDKSINHLMQVIFKAGAIWQRNSEELSDEEIKETLKEIGVVE